MAQRKITSAARIMVEPDGTAKLVDAPLDEHELATLNSRANEDGWEPVAGIVGEGIHIRLNDPQGLGFHRDYAVRWGPPE